MNVLETEWWSLCLPPEWWGESEEESILIGDHDDVGCIEISTLHKEQGDFEAAEVERIARQETGADLSWKAVELGDFVGIHSDMVEEDAAIREWYVACGSMLLFITYSCDLDNRGMDDSAVNEILDTLLEAEEDAG